MYPQHELTRLAAHKAALRRDLAIRRTQCLVAAAALVQPFAWFERVRNFVQRLAPLALGATIPLGFVFARGLAPRRKFLGHLTRWAPFAIAALRSFRAPR